jgi:predicted DNA-binding transcriptional regulator YafY
MSKPKKKEYSSRLNRADDIIRLAIWLQGIRYGVSSKDIQEEFDCSRRTAERAIEVLYNLFPNEIVEIKRDGKRKWRLIDGVINSLISFSKEDIANLEFLRNSSKDEIRKKELDELIPKIKALIPEKNKISYDTDVSAILEKKGVIVRQYSRVKIDPELLKKIQNTLLTDNKLKFDYKNEKGERSKVTLHPYGLIINNIAEHFLVGFSEQRKALRTYTINKIRNLKVLEECFDTDNNFSLHKYSERSFGIYQGELMDVVLEFNEKGSEYVRDYKYHFHPTQKNKKLKNGNLQVKFTACGAYEICHELFKWGELVEVKSPEELRTIYRKELEKLLKKYKTT